MYRTAARTLVRTNRTSLIIRTPLMTTKFYSTATTANQNFRNWKDLQDGEKKQFINEFVELYTSRNKKTKNYYKQLAAGMEEFDDIPAIFGLLYNDLIQKKVQGEEHGEFGRDFFELLQVK